MKGNASVPTVAEKTEVAFVEIPCHTSAETNTYMVSDKPVATILTHRVGEEYLSVLYDHLHSLLYRYHVIRADEPPVLVNRDGRSAGSKSYMWIYRSGHMYPEKQIILYEYQRTRNASHPRISEGLFRDLRDGWLSGLPHVGKGTGKSDHCRLLGSCPQAL